MERFLLSRRDNVLTLSYDFLELFLIFTWLTVELFRGRGPLRTHSDAFILAADSHVVAFPEHGGLRMSAWRHTLQHRGLAGSHHHIAGCLPKIISQDWDGIKGTELAFGSRQMTTHQNKHLFFAWCLSYNFWHENKLIEGNKVNYCVFTAVTPINVLTRLLSFTLPTAHVLLCCLCCQGGWIMHIAQSNME